jgi:inosine-uridine nucleoside N-ribohydrolase
MALGYALHVPGYEVVGITVSGTGIGSCPTGATNARTIAAAVGKPNVPVACGSSTPVADGHVAPDGWRAPSDDLYGVRLPREDSTAADAVSLLGELLANDQPGTVDILTLGPLTNLAQAFAAEPDLAERVRRIVMMAGAIDVPGNVDADPEPGSPEWNVWFDPGAAATVMAAGVPLVVVPLDATNDVPIEPGLLADLEADHASAAANVAYELIARNAFLVAGGQFFWDQLAATVLENPAVVELADARIRVGTTGDELGRMIRDDAGAPVSLAVGASPEAFDAVFMAGLGRGPARDTPFEILGDLGVTYDGAQCTLSGTGGLVAGAYRIGLDNRTDGAAALAVVALHPGASWDQIVAYAAQIAAITEVPDFADIVTVPALDGSAIVDLAPGQVGVGCADVDGTGRAVRAVVSDPVEVTGG